MNRIKIKDLINENNIKWLYETNKIVDSVGNITQDIIREMEKKYNSANIHNVMLKGAKEIPANYKYIGIPNYNMSFSHETRNMRVDINIYIFLCTNMEEVRYYRDQDMLSCKILYGSPNYNMYIGFCIVNGKYAKNSLINDISHEITHINQTINNRKLTNQDEIDKYNKQYDNITKYNLNNDEGLLKDVAYLCYYFTKSEISANLNGLYYQLREYKNEVNKDNYLQYYQQSDFYSNYKEVLNTFEMIKSIPDDEFEEIKTMVQTHEFFKPTINLSLIKDNSIFKINFIKYIERMNDYMKQRINIVLTRIIEESNKNGNNTGRNR